MYNEKRTFRISPIIHLPAVIKELEKSGYTINDLGTAQYTFTYYDTQDGRLYKNTKRLLFNHKENIWQLQKNGDYISSQNIPEEYFTGEKDQLPVELSKLLIKQKLIPYLTAKVSMQSYQIVSSFYSHKKMSLENWEFSNPHTTSYTQTSSYLVLTNKNTSGELSYVSTLIRDLTGFKIVTFDPLETGLTEIKSALPGAPIPNHFHLSKDDTIFQAGCKILEQQAYKMRANTEGTALDLDPEFLHDLRVATRRARFALKIFKPYFEDGYCKELRNELAWIAGLLGALRDIDVFLGNLKKHYIRTDTPLYLQTNIKEYLDRNRKDTLGKLVKALTSSRYTTILHMIESAKTHSLETAEGGSFPAIDIASQFIIKALKKIRMETNKSADGFTAAELHRLRISFKNLRYVCEFFKHFYKKRLNSIIKSLVEFQDCLGLHQDAQIAIKTFLEIQNTMTNNRPIEPVTILAFGALVQVQREIETQQRDMFCEMWDRFPEIQKELVKVI
jgi:CHAD domain-containing protein